MKKVKVLFVVLIGIILFGIEKVNAESVKDNYKKEYNLSHGIIYNKVIRTNDNSYVAIGKVYDEEEGYYDAVIEKYDETGTLIWKKEFGGSDDDEFQGVTESQYGGFIVVGYTYSKDIEGFTSKGMQDCIILKYSDDGEIIWKNILSGSLNEDFYSVIELSDGNIVTGGTIESDDIDGVRKSNDLATTSADLLVTYDKDCNFLKGRLIVSGVEGKIKNLFEKRGGYVLTAGYAGSRNVNRGQVNSIPISALVKKTWTEYIGGMETRDELLSIIENDDDTVVSVGYIASTNAREVTINGGRDAVIMKQSSDGKIIWIKNYGEESDEVFNDVVQSRDGGYIAVGYKEIMEEDEYGDLVSTGSIPIIVKYEEDGTVKWEKEFEYNNEYAKFNEIVVNDDNSYTVLGLAEKYGEEGCIEYDVCHVDSKLIDYNFDLYYDIDIENQIGGNISVDNNKLLFDELANLSIELNPEYVLDEYIINGVSLKDNKFNIKKDTIIKVKYNDKYSYKIIYQSEDEFTDKDIVIKIDGYYTKFDKLFINDVEVDKKHYSVMEGSTIITISKEYLSTLNSEIYNLKVCYTNGKEVDTEVEIKAYNTNTDSNITNDTSNADDVNNPKTYDRGIVSYIFIMIISIFGVVIASIRIKKYD